MKRFMFGFDAEKPEASAKALRAAGFDAVVVGEADGRAAAALNDAGLEIWLCYGAHALGADFDTPAHLSETASGARVRWFGSGCPSDKALSEARLDAAMEKAARIEGLRGVLVDGARFASFASQEGERPFFSCFCQRCMAAMEASGIDATRVRAAVRALEAERTIVDEAAVAEWFRFRALRAAAYFTRFSERAHGSGFRAGAFVFAPSLAGFVGQTAEACRALDVVSPMLYRAWPESEGPACLNHEWAGLIRMFGSETARRLSELAGTDAAFATDRDAASVLRQGFPPERVGLETRAARARLARGQALLPILQQRDGLLMDCAKQAINAGADGFGSFAYGHTPEIPRISD